MLLISLQIKLLLAEILENENSGQCVGSCACLFVTMFIWHDVLFLSVPRPYSSQFNSSLHQTLNARLGKNSLCFQGHGVKAQGHAVTTMEIL